MMKRILALVLCLLMVSSVLLTSGFALEGASPILGSSIVTPTSSDENTTSTSTSTEDTTSNSASTEETVTDSDSDADSDIDKAPVTNIFSMLVLDEEPVSVDGGDNQETNFVAFFNNQGYTDLQGAIDAIPQEGGDYMITLAEGATIDGKFEIHQKTDGVNITIKGSEGAVFSGYIEIYGHARSEGTDTLTFDSIKFETAEVNHVFIEQTCKTGEKDSDTKCYPHNITVTNCSFTANDEAVNTAAGIKFRYGHNIKVSKTTSNGMHSLMQNYAGVGLSVENVTIEGKNGIALGTSQNVILTNVTINATGYGVRADANITATAKLENCKIEAYIPVVVRYADNKNSYELIVTGRNTEMTPTNNEGVWCAVGATEYENKEGVTKDKLGGDGFVVVTLSDTTLSLVGVVGRKNPVATIGTTEYYSLEDAFDAANEAVSAVTITLQQNVTVSNTLQAKNNITFDGGKYKVTFGEGAGFSKDDKGSLAIIGGMFSTDVGQFCATDYKCVLVSGDGDTPLYKVQLRGVALYNNTYYSSLEAAYTANNNKGTITLLADVDLGESVFIVEKEITLDLGGCNITSKSGKYTIDVQSGGILTIIGTGTITNTSKGSTVIRNYGELTIGTLEAPDEESPYITRGETTNEAGNSAVKNEEESTLTICSGTFGGDKRSIQSFGETIIYGGTFEKTVEAWEWTNSDNYTYSSTLTIEGGTFDGTVKIGGGVDKDNKTYVADKTTNTTVTISGGRFKERPAVALLDAGYSAVQDDSTGYFTPVEAETVTLTVNGTNDQPYVLNINGTEQAYDNRVNMTVIVKGGDTVTILLPVGKYSISEAVYWNWRYENILSELSVLSEGTNTYTYTVSSKTAKTGWFSAYSTEVEAVG